MGTERFWERVVPASRQAFPTDLGVVLALVGLTFVGVFLPGVRETRLRLFVGFPFLVFAPGYALVSALFPEKPERTSKNERDSDSWLGAAQRQGVTLLERVGLSFGLSISIVSLAGIALDFTLWGIRLESLMMTIGGFTAVSVAVAAYRRRQLPERDRFVVPFEAWYGAVCKELFHPESRLDIVLNVVVILGLISTLLGVGYVATAPHGTDRVTQFYLLNETDGGKLVADDYPTTFGLGGSRSVEVGITNQEREPAEYTVIVALQRVPVGTNNTTSDRSVLDHQELDRFTMYVTPGQTRHRTYDIEPPIAGKNLRLTFLLYKSDPPTSPTVQNAYREVHLWIDVVEPDRSNRSTARIPS